jgi:UDP-N-acetylglucosamine--dolichyl-phosphate N-acetylglucosaminephosphotransferase
MIGATAVTTVVISFGITFYLMPIFIRKLEENEDVVRDMYKRFKHDVPTKGGLAVLFSIYLTVVIVPVFFRVLNKVNSSVEVPKTLSPTDQGILLVIMMFALYGIIDDLMNVGRPAKVALPILFSLPLIVVVTPSSLTLPLLGKVDFNDGITFPLFGFVKYARITRYVVMPIYIMVVANLMNMHSGFNGLQSGLSLIILTALLIKSVHEDIQASIITLGALTGAMGAFWLFNRYPSRIFEGNIGALAVGAGIGSIIVVNGFIVSGFIMLIPHTVNFMMYIYWRAMRILRPENRKYGLGKFGTLLADGCLEVPNPFTLKWVLPFYFKMNERNATWVMYGVTMVFCGIGILMY